MGTGANVHSEVDTPEQFGIHRVATCMPVDPIAVEIDIAGLAALRVVFGIRGIPLHENLVFAVAVDIAHRAVAGTIGGAVHGSGALQVDLHVGLCPGQRGEGGLDGLAIDFLHNLVAAFSPTACIRETGGSGEVAGDDFAIAQHVEGHRRVVLVAQQTPAHKYAGGLGRNGHKASAEFFHLAGGRDLCPCGSSARQDHAQEGGK